MPTKHKTQKTKTYSMKIPVWTVHPTKSTLLPLTISTFLFSHVHYKWLDILYSANCTPPCQIILYTKYTPPNFSNARSHQTRNTPLPSNLTWIQTLPWIINPTRQKGKIIFNYKNDIIKGPLLCNPEIKLNAINEVSDLWNQLCCTCSLINYTCSSNKHLNVTNKCFLCSLHLSPLPMN